MTGVRTVLWKELRETFRGGSRPMVGLILGGVMAALLAIFIPIVMSFGVETSHRWVYVFGVAGSMSAFAAFMGFFGPMATVVDSFAGERERHTLETLLATPLTDRAILWGKVIAQYVGVWMTVAILAVASSATATIIAGLPGLVVLPLVLVGGLVGSTVTATLMVGLGSLISLRAPTVKKGQEWLGYAMFPIFFLPMMLGPLFTMGGGGLREKLIAGLAFAIGLPVLIVLLGIIFMVLLFTRFRRDRLVGH
ncbi:MAG: ABC transporter permease subunit [Candidatus Thermoplasmatota archaeon]